MLDTIKKYAAKVGTTPVLNYADEDGYPASMRCPVTVGDSAVALQAEHTDRLREGPASLLWHYHNELMWAMKSFLVRGTLSESDGGWSFTPKKIVPGAGVAGMFHDMGFMRAASKTAKRYIAKRNIDTPVIDWKYIKQMRAEVSGK